MSAAAASTLLGGVGLFLLGMSLMTDSLTTLGGPALRRLVRTLTRKRWAGLLTGALVTATVQSSSATTLVTVGFVSAGLLSFADSLGLVFGANVGTTSTAWIVAQLGLEVQVSTVALPLVGVGALVRLFTRGRWSRLALALSGFGLVFVGIDVMQTGMAGLDLDLRPSDAAGGFLGTLGLVAVGALMTVVLQSSSAAVTTTLVAVHAGALGLEQAGALVVGQNVGTTVTAVLGAIGGTIAARRTAVAHTLFNVFTAVLAIAILGPFMTFVRELGARFFDESPQTAIALFHTLFNVAGVAIFFPLTGPFARFVERIVPQRGSATLRHLDRNALQVPAVAIEAARRATAATVIDALQLAVESLNAAGHKPASGLHLSRVFERREAGERSLSARVHDARAAAAEIGDYLARVRTSAQPTSVRDEHVELLHAVDHLRRLFTAIEREDDLAVVRDDEELRRLATAIAQDLEPVIELRDQEGADAFGPAADRMRVAVEREEARREAHRAVLLARLADGELTPQDVEALSSAARWLGKFPKHAERALLHLAWTSGSPPIADED